MGSRPPSPTPPPIPSLFPTSTQTPPHLFPSFRSCSLAERDHHLTIPPTQPTHQIMKHPRTTTTTEPQDPAAGEVSLALSLSTDSATTTSDSTAGTTTTAPAKKRARRRGAVVATSGEGEFVCRTCSRAFTSFQALGGHRTSHLRGRHGLELGVGARALRQHKQQQAAAASSDGGSGGGGDKPPHQQHECHICGLGFEMGQALGGHMRRHREEMGAAEAADAWVWRTDQAPRAAADPPVLLELFA